MVSVTLLLLAFAAGGMCGSNIWCDHANSGRAENGRPMDGLAEFVGNFAWGVIAPAVTGFVIDYTGRFFVAFRDYGCRATAARSFLYLCYWPGEGKIAWGTMT